MSALPDHHAGLNGGNNSLGSNVGKMSANRNFEAATVGLMYGGDRSEVINETARQLGYDRTGSRISERLGEIYDQMKEERAI